MSVLTKSPVSSSGRVVSISSNVSEIVDSEKILDYDILKQTLNVCGRKKPSTEASRRTSWSNYDFSFTRENFELIRTSSDGAMQTVVNKTEYAAKNPNRSKQAWYPIKILDFNRFPGVHMDSRSKLYRQYANNLFCYKKELDDAEAS